MSEQRALTPEDVIQNAWAVHTTSPSRADRFDALDAAEAIRVALADGSISPAQLGMRHIEHDDEWILYGTAAGAWVVSGDA